MDRAIDKYLARHAEPEACLTHGICDTCYQHCLVMPAYRETLGDIEAALAAVCTHPFLLILVVNAPGDDEATRALLHEVRSNSTQHACIGPLSLHRTRQAYDVLLVDRCSVGQTIPARRGVGLARKIGADIALFMMAQGAIDPGPIYSTDADVTLPPDYFTAAESQIGPNTAAINFPFEHIATKDLALAAQLYEISMLYYVAGLKYARSPYAHITIGSVLAINPVHYARVRGFPRRNAAEDFYLLNKLAKTGAIRQLASPLIRISARESDRVPFGTGPALSKILQMTDPLSEFTLYDPRVFESLRVLIDALKTAGEPDQFKKILSPSLTGWAERSGLLQQVASHNRRIDDYLDGFRTLKLIHSLRDEYFPSVPLRELVGSKILPISESEPQAIRQYLAHICFAPEKR
ncbi:MAG: hypothetical protein WD558_08895 [Pseudomonadales bacterium]